MEEGERIREDDRKQQLQQQEQHEEEDDDDEGGRGEKSGEKEDGGNSRGETEGQLAADTREQHKAESNTTPTGMSGLEGRDTKAPVTAALRGSGSGPGAQARAHPGIGSEDAASTPSSTKTTASTTTTTPPASPASVSNGSSTGSGTTLMAQGHRETSGSGVVVPMSVPSANTTTPSSPASIAAVPPQEGANNMNASVIGSSSGSSSGSGESSLVVLEQPAAMSAVGTVGTIGVGVGAGGLSCSELLKYGEFKAKMEAKLQMATSVADDPTSTGRPGGLPPGQDSVFRLLMQKIKGLEMKQAIADLYTQQVSDCYHSVMAEVGAAKLKEEATRTEAARLQVRLFDMGAVNRASLLIALAALFLVGYVFKAMQDEKNEMHQLLLQKKSPVVKSREAVRGASLRGRSKSKSAPK